MRKLAIAFLLLGLSLSLMALKPKASFTVIVLGAHGGLTDGDLSAYLVSRKGSTEYLCLDAGTVLKGITESARRGAFKDVKVPKDSQLSLEGYVLQDRIKAYALSHAHLDHVQGLVIDSTDDTSKKLFGRDETIDHLRDNMFNWVLWPNFGNEGERPLNRYTYERMTTNQEYATEAGLTLRTYPLSHAGHPCSAFLVKADDSYLLYLGDTGPDSVEKSDNLQNLFKTVAPLNLKGIFLECSFPNGRKDNELFGHLTPDHMLGELRKANIRNLPVIVTHIKPSLNAKDDVEKTIARQLKAGNDLGIRFIIPHQGDRIEL